MSVTPMMQQYLDIKSEHQDALLMFRLGDFYELFFDDAVTASRVLEITLTGRDAGSAGRIPMCGVPYHAAEQYIGKLVDQGYCVAICEQTEDPKQAKGLVRREVVRIITPGTILRDEGSASRLLCSVVHRKGQWGVAAVDVSTGELWCGQYGQVQAIVDLFMQWHPLEVLRYASETDGAWNTLEAWCEQEGVRISLRAEPKHGAAANVDVLCKQFGVPSLTPFGLESQVVAAEAAGLAVGYINDTQKVQIHHLRFPQNLALQRHLTIDYTAQRNLELLETARTRQRKGSLFGLLDRTKTSMGGRLLRRWIERPLQDVEEILNRQEAVGLLVDNFILRTELEAALEAVYDLDRLIGRVALGSANGRDMIAIAKSISVIPTVQSLLGSQPCVLLDSVARALPNLTSLATRIQNTLVEEPPVSVRDGGIIRSGVNPQLDALRDTNASGKAWLAALEQRERERTGIKSLKVGYNKVFGYYIEVSKNNAHLVPGDYERRQTLSTGERYVLPELKAHEARILGAEEQSVALEYELFLELREEVLASVDVIQRASEQIAIVDVLCALASVSQQYGYARPVMVDERGIEIVQGRHPMVEAAHPGGFVPNDIHLTNDQSFILITGPNMAGKSTYMRQAALIAIMAHIGCFVPAESARIGLVDRVFTRIGASDDLGAGQSTFMVEMVELAQILRQASNRSLVLLDEIGRGTSTYDGLSIAEAVMEALQTPGKQPLALFATHYHELTQTAERMPGVVNYSVLVQETSDGIAFLHSVVKRPADRSYGIQVARLAGIPDRVIARATQLLAAREHGVFEQTAAAHETPNLPLFSAPIESFVEKLAGLNVLNTTPLEAIHLLHDLVSEAGEVLQWVKSR